MLVDVGGGAAEIRSFAFEPHDKKFYWVDSAYQQLRRSNMDGTQVELLAIRPPESQNPQNRDIYGVAVLPERRWLYLNTGYFIGIDRYSKTDRLEIPPLLKPTTKPAPPRIASIEPLKAAAGDEVVVSGAGFKGATKAALFDDAAGGETTVDFKLLSDVQFSFKMPKLSEGCRHAAVILVTPGGVTVTLPTSLSVARPNIFNILPGEQEMNTATTKGKYANFWYVVGQHQKKLLGSQMTQTQIAGLNWSLAYVEPQGMAFTGQRGHNVLFLKDGAVSGLPQWRNVVYHEPFAIINNSFRESLEETETTLIPVPAIRPSFLPELLEYEQPPRSDPAGG